MPETMATVGIDDAIDRMEKLYRAMTGEDAPPAGAASYAPIPAEKDPVRHVEEQMDRLLAMLGPAERTGAEPPWIPPMSVFEKEQEILILLDLPGVTRDHVEVSIQGSVLTVSGQRPSPATQELRPRINERPLGAFRRTLWIAGGARGPEAAVQIRDGVLEIRIPREPVSFPPVKKLSVH